MPDNSHYSIPGERYPANPFDLSTDLFSVFSNQVIHLVIYPDGPVRCSLLEKAVEKASLAEPITRCRIIRKQDTLWWQEMRTFCIADHVLRLSSRKPKELLYQALSYPLDPYLGKVFQVILIDNPDGTGDCIVINAHHIAMDGSGLKDFAELIMRCYTEYQTGHLTEIPPTPIGSRQLPKISTLISENRHLKTDQVPIGWCSRITVPVQSIHAEKYFYSILTLCANRTSIIQNIRREWGITINDFMLAVIARAIGSVLQMKSETTVPLYTTIDLRRYLPNMPEPSLVNFSTSFEVRIQIKPEEYLEDTGKRVHGLMNRIKSQSPGVDEAREAEKLFESGYQAAFNLVNASWNNIQDAGSKTTIFSNTGIISHDQVNPGFLSVHNAYILPGFFKPPGFFFLLSTFADIITLSASYAVPAYNPYLVSQMFSYIDSIIPGFGMYPGEYEIIK